MIDKKDSERIKKELLKNKDNVQLQKQLMERIKNIEERRKREHLEFENRCRDYILRKTQYQNMRKYDKRIVDLYQNGKIMLNNQIYLLNSFYITYNSAHDYDFHLVCVDSNYTDILKKSYDKYEYDGVIKFIDSTVFTDLIKQKDVKVDYDKMIIDVQNNQILEDLLKHWNGSLHEEVGDVDAIKVSPVIKKYIDNEYIKEKKMKTIRDFDLQGKRVIIRVDFNVPIKNGVIQDDNRIKESLLTINYAIENKAKVILLSHLGRIKKEDDKKDNTLYPVSVRLSELLKKRVIFIPETRGKNVLEAVNNMADGDVLLLENTRYEDIDGNKESGNDLDLAKYWASLGDIFINDAFGTSHRAHASNVGIGSLLPSGIGFLIEKELKNILPVINHPKHPFTVILGGSKVSDKIGVIENLIDKCDYLLIGGGMAYTFLKAKGIEIGKSLLDSDSLDYCKNLLSKTNKIILPIDHVVSTNIEDKNWYIKTSISKYEMGLDIGPETLKLFKKYIDSSATIIWNGPVGMFENKLYQNGTIGICKCFKKSQTVIVGGGDTASAVINFGYKDYVTHISTGGGASLELLEGKELPGISVIGK